MAEQSEKSEGPIAGSVERLRSELEGVFDFVRSQGGRALDAIGWRNERSFDPALDVIERGDAFQVVVDLPGVDSSSLDVSLTGNMLTLKGNKPETPLTDHEKGHLGERPSGEFTRSVPMPAPVNPDGVTAETKNGVLTITLQKSEQAKARQISVKSGDSAGT